MNAAKSVRWTINKAASEFGVGPKLVSSRLKAADIKPGKDGKFSTAEIAQAIFDSEHVQRVRLIKEQADAKAYLNAQSAGELVPVQELAERMSLPLRAMRNCITGAPGLDSDSQRDLLENLKELWKAVFYPNEAPTRPCARSALRKATRQAKQEIQHDDYEEA